MIILMMMMMLMMLTMLIMMMMMLMLMLMMMMMMMGLTHDSRHPGLKFKELLASMTASILLLLSVTYCSIDCYNTASLTFPY